MSTIKILSFIFIVVLHSSAIRCQSFRPSILDTYYPLYRLYRNTLATTLGRTSENMANLRQAKQLNMIQDEIPLTQPFPCNVTGFRSAKRPSSVHQVRPGDIDVIAALGDSLTAGYGLVATNLLQVFMENRGLSWSIGGQGTWRQFLTLPNILKEFNPNLVGYSLRDSYVYDRNSQFNPAEGAAISSEIPYMAKVLIKRIKSDKRVNLKKDWKLVTIMIGSNNFCLDICYYDNMTSYLEMHRKDMIQVLRLLRDNLPRTIVNFVPPPDLKPFLEIKPISDICQATRQIECYCLTQDRFKNKIEMFLETGKQWSKVDEEVSNMPEFHQNDFTVIFQPSLINMNVPHISEGVSDLSYLSMDCFHISQKFNARAANYLWNNMLERVGSKTAKFLPLFERFLCPSKENPYIFTNQNR